MSMSHEDNIAVLADGIWVRGRRDRATTMTTSREFVMLRAESVRSEKPTTRHRTQPFPIIRVDEP